VIVLPWPPKELSPNARAHFHAKAPITRAYRNQAYWLTKAAGATVPEQAPSVVLRCEFFPPDARRRDVDGMFSSIKAGLDGIADALEVNDHRFDFLICRAPPVKGGKVVVTVEAM
jgi:crossover junction endodeoxyribonuclease RusA